MQVGNRAATSGNSYTISDAKVTIAPTLSSEITRAHVAIDTAFKTAATLKEKLSPISNATDSNVAQLQDAPKIPTLIDEARALANHIESLTAYLQSMIADLAL